jgi:hypothetical protein
MMGTIASYILGFSELTYVFLGISVSVVSMKYLLLNLYKNSRNKIRNLLIIVVFLAIVIIIIDYRFVNATNLESMIVIYRTRFINTDYGVYAVILYGLKLAVKSLFIGTGLGTFMSRGATTLGSPLLYNAPPVMVVYGQLSNVTTTVDGVSSWLILLIEGGIIAAVIFAFVIRKVISYKSNNYMVKYILSILKVYFILITLYTPYIFDSEFGYLLIIGYVTILNWLNECEKDKQVVTE